MKMYAKTKEIDPVWGGHALAVPPGSANDQHELKMEAQMSIFFNLLMIFEPGLTKVQNSHWKPLKCGLTFSMILMNFKCTPALMKRYLR